MIIIKQMDLFPYMIEEKDVHLSVSMGDKLFIIPKYNSSDSELLHSFTRKFTLFQSKDFYISSIEAVSIAYNIIMFSMRMNKTIYIYIQCITIVGVMLILRI